MDSIGVIKFLTKHCTHYNQPNNQSTRFNFWIKRDLSLKN